MPSSASLRCALALIAWVISVDAAAAQGDGRERGIGWLAESLCVDTPPPYAIVHLSPGCRTKRLRRADDSVVVEKHDWPGHVDKQGHPKGYQRSSAFLAPFQGRSAVVHTFDFGAGNGRKFGKFDKGRGDGGQVVMFEDGSPYIVMTEDGGSGVQWFQGAFCRDTTSPRDRGWLLFGRIVTDRWRSEVVRLRTAGSSAECPLAFDYSYTRWKRATVNVPYLLNGRPQPRPLDFSVIVSEHFGGKSVSAADHMERFYLAQGAGLVRWERWENTDLTKVAGAGERARQLADTGRCPPLSREDRLPPMWKRTDCRTWTNFVTTRSKVDFRWP